jgi:predicted CXXCH cytochrome family protein
MSLRPRLTKNTLIFGGAAAWGLLLISCVAVNRTMVAPVQIAGASYVGSKQCAECHADQTAHFVGSTHAKVGIADPKLGETSCEACHGPGSLHVKAGGSKTTIINPKKSAESCFQCHLDKRGQFSLPNSHPIMSGKVTCVDCHNVHEGNAVRGTGADMESQNETCTKCHTAQRGPFMYEHSAMREGCTACHNPHGSVNAKMLVARDANLCNTCHLLKPSVPNNGEINSNSIRSTIVNGIKVASPENHNNRLQQGTCWVAGCHEAVHGSNANNHLRR